MALQQTRHRKNAPSRQRPDLPLFYYHTNFCDMLSFVESRYAHVLQAEHLEFLDDFQVLPHGAQCLYVRIAGRKGRVFDTGKLSYSEIPDIPASLRALSLTGFLSPVSKEYYSDGLSALTKPELIAYMRERLHPREFKRSWKKDDLMAVALTLIPFDHAILPPNLVMQGRSETLRYLSYLYFGKIEENLQSFTLRDLGIRKTPDFKADYSARFETLEEA